MNLNLGQFKKSAKKQNEKKDVTQFENVKQIVCFFLDTQEYGIEIEYISEVVSLLPITRLIHVPNFVKGVMNLRGNIIGVIDIKVFFNLTPIKENIDTKIIVTNYKEKTVGLMVDKISEIQLININAILPTPPTVPKRQQTFLKGVIQLKEHPLMILNIEELLFCEDAKQFEEKTTNF
ncbi:MAG TPA: chemotaxis protein CheW [bacterium]|nr:chemotaxis protein CheW [bacterium]HOL47455.1 chemotaxis protein CheW [bacterium]HPQ18935.1 chemotaxis protein CheW [bacterium]